ncbi:MAG: GDP-mannose 4,6-dehydratase [Bacteriovoracia bacterium]
MSQFWKHRSVYVTGGTGLLGSELVSQLVNQGANVIALVRDEPPSTRFEELSLSKKTTIVRGCVEDEYLQNRVLNEYEIDTVFHLAAQTIVGTSERSPLSTFESNIRGTYSLLEACRRNSLVKRVVVASSDKAYGHQSNLPYSEETPLQGRGPYDVSKSCADLIAQSYFYSYKSPICVTRCGNFFGPGDLNFNRIVPGTIRSFLRNEKPIIRSNGKYIRDYIYVGDGALAYMQLAEQMEKKQLFGEAFNFSYGRKLTVLEMVNAIANLMGKKDLEPIVQDQAKLEIPAQYLSSEKAERVLGWKPTFDLEKGLKETIPWYEKHEASVIKK